MYIGPEVAGTPNVSLKADAWGGVASTRSPGWGREEDLNQEGLVDGALDQNIRHSSPFTLIEIEEGSDSLPASLIGAEKLIIGNKRSGRTPTKGVRPESVRLGPVQATANRPRSANVVGALGQG